MKTKTRAYKRIKRGSCRHFLAVLIATVFFLSGISTAFAGTAEFEDYSELAGKRISVLTGAPFEELVHSKVPDVGEFSYYNSMPDMILALKNNKTDAILMNNAVADLALNRNEDLSLFPKELQDGVFGFAFARAICNRVFYMDQGGIYEEGSPEQIFDHPKKESTKQFIQKLKVLKFTIDSLDFDFVGAGTDIDKYCLHNDIPPRIKYRIRLTCEELVVQILKRVLEQTPIQLTIEYSQIDERAVITAAYGGERFDPANSDNSLAYSFLKGSVEDLSYQYDPQADDPNVVRVTIRE